MIIKELRKRILGHQTNLLRMHVWDNYLKGTKMDLREESLYDAERSSFSGVKIAPSPSLWLTIQYFLCDVRVNVLPPLLLVLGWRDLDALPHTGQVDAAAGHDSRTMLQAERGQEKTAQGREVCIK